MNPRQGWSTGVGSAFKQRANHRGSTVIDEGPTDAIDEPEKKRYIWSNGLRLGYWKFVRYANTQSDVVLPGLDKLW